PSSHGDAGEDDADDTGDDLEAHPEVGGEEALGEYLDDQDSRRGGEYDGAGDGLGHGGSITQAGARPPFRRARKESSTSGGAQVTGRLAFPIEPIRSVPDTALGPSGHGAVVVWGVVARGRSRSGSEDACPTVTGVLSRSVPTRLRRLSTHCVGVHVAVRPRFSAIKCEPPASCWGAQHA